LTSGQDLSATRSVAMSCVMWTQLMPAFQPPSWSPDDSPPGRLLEQPSMLMNAESSPTLPHKGTPHPSNDCMTRRVGGNMTLSSCHVAGGSRLQRRGRFSLNPTGR
jgi:hypothetical protein